MGTVGYLSFYSAHMTYDDPKSHSVLLFLRRDARYDYRIDRVDRIITGAYKGPFAKRHCAALRHARTLMWTVMTLPNALDAFRPNHFVLLVESGPNVELCGSDGTDDYDDSSEADDEQNQRRLRSFGAVISTS